jgi:hypothetical protein
VVRELPHELPPEDYVSGMAGLTPPAGNAARLPAPIIANYNAYVTSGVMTNTSPVAAFSTVTPFELGTNDYTVLKPFGSLSGTVDRSAKAGVNVACISCHRAHASGFESGLRFFYLNEFSMIGDAAGVAPYDSSSTERTRSTTASTRTSRRRPTTAARRRCSAPGPARPATSATRRTKPSRRPAARATRRTPSRVSRRRCRCDGGGACTAARA